MGRQATSRTPQTKLMNYYLWISGAEHGPYTMEQIRAGLADGTIDAQQTTRTEDSADWKQLSEFVRVSQPKPASPPASSPQTRTAIAPGFQRSVIVQVLHGAAYANFGLALVPLAASWLGTVLFAIGGVWLLRLAVMPAAADDRLGLRGWRGIAVCALGGVWLLGLAVAPFFAGRLFFMGWPGVVPFVVGGFSLLCFAVVIDSLQEIVFRLRNLERVAASSER